jgi:hypothetical protein
MSLIKDLKSAFSNEAKAVNTLSQQEKLALQEPLLAFKSTSFVKYKKNKSWYIVLGVVAILLVLAGIWTGSSTFPIAVLVFALVYLSVNKEDPSNIDFAVSKIGIQVGTRFYAFTELRTFWIEYDPPYYQAIHFVHKNKYKEETTVQFHGVNPATIREVLVNFLPEWEERQKTLAEKLTRFLGL